jgi:hypothetical protein
MLVELPAEIEASVKAQASVRGLTVEAYLRDVVERDLRQGEHADISNGPFESGWGMLAAYGPIPSAKEIDENRAEMFHGIGESF